MTGKEKKTEMLLAYFDSNLQVFSE